MRESGAVLQYYSITNKIQRKKYKKKKKQRNVIAPFQDSWLSPPLADFIVANKKNSDCFCRAWPWKYSALLRAVLFKWHQCLSQLTSYFSCNTFDDSTSFVPHWIHVNMSDKNVKHANQLDVGDCIQRCWSDGKDYPAVVLKKTATHYILYYRETNEMEEVVMSGFNEGTEWRRPTSSPN